MSEIKGYYEILGLDKNASQQEIFDAYQKLGVENQTNVDQAIEEAYNALSNAKSKEIYDRYGALALAKSVQGKTSHTPMVEHIRDGIDKKHKLKILLNYFLGYTLLFPLGATLIIALVAVNMKWTTFEAFDSSIFNTVSMLIVTAFVLWKITKLAKPMLINDLVIFKENLKPMIKLAFKTYAIMFCANILISFLTAFVNPEPALNQQAIEMQLQLSPLYVIFLTVVFAPIVEEVVFRGCIFNLLNKKMGVNTSAIISGILFGSMHVLISIISGNLLDLINILSYASMGYFLGRIYYQTNTIWAPITVHFINNAIATIIMLLLPLLV